MLLSQNGLAAFTRRGFHGALFSALLAFALFDSEAASAQEMKQIKLTEKYIQDFMAAAKDIANLNDDANPDQPEAIAKRNGFASLAEYEDVGMNISRKQIAALKADNPSRRGKRRTI